jgi:hypothetical protein
VRFRPPRCRGHDPESPAADELTRLPAMKADEAAALTPADRLKAKHAAAKAKAA